MEASQTVIMIAVVQLELPSEEASCDSEAGR